MIQILGTAINNSRCIPARSVRRIYTRSQHPRPILRGHKNPTLNWRRILHLLEPFFNGKRGVPVLVIFCAQSALVLPQLERHIAVRHLTPNFSIILFVGWFSKSNHASRRSQRNDDASAGRERISATSNISEHDADVICHLRSLQVCFPEFKRPAVNPV